MNEKNLSKLIVVILLSLPLIWVNMAYGDENDDAHEDGKEKVVHHPSDGHKHKKKRKKSKKSQHKNHKHKAGSHEDEEHHDDEHHDEEYSHDHSGHEHKKKSKKKKGKKKHKGHRHKQEHQDDDDHDHQHGDEDNHSDHSDGEKEHEGHAGHGDHDDSGHGEHGEESFGEGKAITEVKNEGESFKLALEAQPLLGLGFGVIEKSAGRGVFMVPTKSLIFFNDEKGIFVKVGEWFKLIDVELVKKGSNWSQVKSNDLSVGQKIVVEGTGLLRVAHLQASGQGGKGHAH